MTKVRAFKSSQGSRKSWKFLQLSHFYRGPIWARVPSSENYQKTNLVALQEVNDALISVKRDGEKLDKHKKQLALENQDFGYTQQRYDQGIISKLDLIQMQENLLSVNKLVANSTGACYVDYISLYKAVGSKL